ncbi:Salicylate O-methyltransferase [Triticum urartu]|uniref:Salicylate O-methyltransferase n=2 Tax=Triticum urartu TaxID=4572 RepID=M8ACV4_TRIUA|nr:anthranilate O-methyltransferase 3-like [Triticum urartu]XP_048568636.1 anthranilate O-methyltransferase 3-like [Triticum urartu]EMS62585.1 Salicylate O-methyltransferase [Triticum urartu]
MASMLTVHMNQGQGETSYARNSFVQNGEQKRMKPLIEAAIVDLCPGTSTLLPTKMVIVDLGCSSGPNAIALVSIAIEAIHNHCHQFLQPPPEVSVLLNDLPDNDFNMVVKNLVMLRQSSNDTIVMAGVLPGSFYERLFTSGSLHLVFSSNSLHWLSKAPEDLTKNQIPAYDIDEHTRLERRPMVLQAYAQQFRKDFTRFLELRAKEMIPGGRMVVSLVGRDSDVITPEFSHLCEFVAQILSVMVSEGVIDKAKFDSFYLPVYEPSNKELREIIQDEGSFSITEMQANNPFVGLDSALMVPSRFASVTRAIFEPIIVLHFGEVMDEFMRTLERRWSLEGSLQLEHAKSPRPMLAVSLKKA